ncbi:superoxide dismutase [Spongiactinospora rosea]|uniref:Superoxide dismutase n=1 Tax=Spongiactinospora rosea TaxID=2248750 RepID=A0A366M7G2_9ACTN|nr:superoxide dismutase [Spongiactinospora rosea]
MFIGSAAQAAATPEHGRVSTAFEIPGDRVYPEGIAADPHTGDIYVGAYEGGAIFKVTRGQRVAKEFLPSDGRAHALGLEVDRARRLWVADRNTGVAVYDIPRQRLIARFVVPRDADRLINDVAIAPDGTAYITESRRAEVYRVTPRQLEEARDHDGPVPITPAFDLSGHLDPREPGAITLNGIVAAPTGRYLLTVDMTGGDLYRIELPSGRVSRVALRGGDLNRSDGMELRNGTLWVAHPILDANAISRWSIGKDGRTAQMTRRITDQALQLPTTMVRTHGGLYVVRSQFDKGGPSGEGTPQLPFSIAFVRI